MGDAGASEAEAALRVCATELADAVFGVLPIWVTRSIVGRCEDAGVIVDDTVLGMASIGASRACG